MSLIPGQVFGTFHVGSLAKDFFLVSNGRERECLNRNFLHRSLFRTKNTQLTRRKENIKKKTRPFICAILKTCKIKVNIRACVH